MIESKRPSAFCALLVCCMASAQWANAADNVSLGETYAYFLRIPGEALPTPTFYLDDPHAVHTTGLGAFSTGDLTDGAIQLCTDGDPSCNEMTSPNSAVVGIWGESNATPAVEIIFDLGAVWSIESITVGTAHRACCGSGVPDDVDVSFSTTGTDPTDFGTPTNYDLWTAEPAGDSHHEIALAVAGSLASYVKLSFDGGSVVNGENKYLLDEITIMGDVPPVPTLGQYGLVVMALLLAVGGCVFIFRRRRIVVQ
jgi:hypothetical protein